MGYFITIFLIVIGLKKNNLITKIPSWGKSWKVCFDLKLTGVIRNWGSIVHFTQGGDMSTYGDRIPAVWTYPGNTRLHFTASVNNIVNKQYNSAAVPLNRYVKVRIEQRYVSPNVYRYTVFLRGKKIYTLLNRVAKIFKNVKVYAGDPWYPHAKGSIKNLIYENLKDHAVTSGKYVFFSPVFC